MDNEYINKQLHTFADSFINNLTPKAIDEISGGYLKDIDKLMSFVIKMGGNIIGAKQYIDEKLDGKPSPSIRLSKLGFK